MSYIDFTTHALDPDVIAEWLNIVAFALKKQVICFQRIPLLLYTVQWGFPLKISY